MTVPELTESNNSYAQRAAAMRASWPPALRAWAAAFGAKMDAERRVRELDHYADEANPLYAPLFQAARRRLLEAKKQLAACESRGLL